MLNDVWNGLVNKVEATKRQYDELEAGMMSGLLPDDLLMFRGLW